MRFLIVLITLLCALTTASYAAGVQRIEISVGDGGQTLQGVVWYPCAAPPETIAFRSVDIAGAMDCPIEGEALPLIVISHGARGWFGGHHDTAAALADAGFVVAAVTHPDQGRRRWRTDRPAAVKSLIDHMLTVWPDHGRIDAERIGFFGYSRGGYTGLVLIGGEPDFRWFLWHCLFAWSDPICMAPPERRSDSASAPDDEKDEEGPIYTHDPRIKAAVLAAPLGLIFSASGLADATVPVQLWRPEKDQVLLFPNHADDLSRLLPVKPDYRVIPGAGHFSILAPCGPRQREISPAICKDPPGFDRVAFHKTFNTEVTAFFKNTIGAR